MNTHTHKLHIFPIKFGDGMGEGAGIRLSSPHSGFCSRYPEPLWVIVLALRAVLAFFFPPAPNSLST